jgi:hypothetical protein
MSLRQRQRLQVDDLPPADESSSESEEEEAARPAVNAFALLMGEDDDEEESEEEAKVRVWLVVKSDGQGEWCCTLTRLRVGWGSGREA